MGLFGKKKTQDPRSVRLNEVLHHSLIHSKTPEGIDEETYRLIGLIVQKCNLYAEEMKKAMGYIYPNSVIGFIKKEYTWIDKTNLKLLGDRACDRLK